jgi:transposase-like protein
MKRREAVRLYKEEGLPADMVAQEIGLTRSCIFEWVKRYREYGEGDC